MLFKFFRNGQGGGSGPVDYLVERDVVAYDQNRNGIRDVRPSFNRPDSNPSWRKFAVAGQLVRGNIEAVISRSGKFLMTTPLISVNFPIGKKALDQTVPLSVIFPIGNKDGKTSQKSSRHRRPGP